MMGGRSFQDAGTFGRDETGLADWRVSPCNLSAGSGLM